MTSSLAYRLNTVDLDSDIAPVLQQIERDRKRKVLGVLAGLVALVVSLFAVAYLNIAQTVDAGPPGPSPDTHPGASGY